MWTLILTVALKFLDIILTKVGVSQETKIGYFEWVKLTANDIKSSKLLEYGDKQKKWLEEHPWPESNVQKP
jgi:hypothetical protein